MTLDQLRRAAIHHSLFRAPTLLEAVERLGYVQADPIRAPARAQDLILFQRVAGYRIDDLERHYPSLPVFEDAIFNYGFFPNAVAKLLYPRALSARSTLWARRHRRLLEGVAGLLNEGGEWHPREVEGRLNAGKRTNGWGGTSSATTMALELLQRQGVARVVRRDKGIRVYVAQASVTNPLSNLERADGLLNTVVNLYSPIQQSTLMPFLRWMSSVREGVDCVAALERAIKEGRLRRETLDGGRYIWPAALTLDAEPPDEVRLLAPFDPVVWCRKRFAHCWGWDYRFEAYTPAHKRVRGYYALPMLWRDEVIGWANARVQNAQLIVEPGLVVSKHPGAAFTRALERECGRMAAFLSPGNQNARL